MSDWEYVPKFPTVRADSSAASDQLMPARWWSRVSRNIAYLDQIMRYGNPACRCMSLMNLTSASYVPMWQGWYYHSNDTIHGTYTIYRTSTGVRIDNYEHSPDSSPPLYDPSTYLPVSGSPTNLVFDLYGDDNAWHQVYSDSQSTETPNKAFSITVKGLSYLTPGKWYRIRMQTQNGLVELNQLYATGSASYTWPTLPTVTDGTVPAIADWNTFVDALNYLREVGESPRAFTATCLKSGKTTDTTPRSTIVWRGLLKHRSGTLRYRMRCQAHTANASPGGGSQDYGMGEMQLWIVVAGTSYQITGSHAVNSAYSKPVDPNTSVQNQFSTGATIRFLATCYNPDGSEEPGTYTERYRYVEGSWDFNGVTGLNLGDWYEIQVRSSSSVATAYRGGLDYCYEVDGESTSPVNAVEISHGVYITGSVGTAIATAWVTDLTALKTLADGVVQVIAPDYYSDGTWVIQPTSGNNGTLVQGDRPSYPWFTRQRPLLRWQGGNIPAAIGITLLWGDPTSPQTTPLYINADGAVDLRGLKDLDLGTDYWLAPVAVVQRAAEVFG